MDGLSVHTYRGIRGYWKKKRAGYKRLNATPTRKARVELAQLGPPEAQSGAKGGGRRRRRLWRWRIRISPRIRLGSPKKWLASLRDAYVKMMLNFASSAALGGGFGAAMDYGGFGRQPLKEYDERKIVEIYKSVVMAQGQMVPLGAANLGSQQQVVCYGR